MLESKRGSKRDSCVLDGKHYVIKKCMIYALNCIVKERHRGSTAGPCLF
jgi:hypothetical protein